VKRKTQSGLVWIVLVLVSTAASGCEGIRSQLRSPSERFMLEGDRLAAADRKAEAILAYRQAVKQDSRNALALRKLARAYAEQGRRRLARRYWQKAVEIQPSSAETANVLALLTPPASANSLPRPLWQTFIGEDVPTGLTAGDGEVYVALEGGQVQALNAVTGMTIWQVKLDTKLTSPPTVSGGLLHVGGQDGALRALSARDGSERWKFMTPAP